MLKRQLGHIPQSRTNIRGGVCVCVCMCGVGGGGGPSSIPGLFSCLLEDGLKRALESKLQKCLLVFCSYLWLLLGTTLA